MIPASLLAWRGRALLAVAAVGATCAFACFVNPEHDQQVASLGPDTGGPPGPLHRAGQPCLVCHGGEGPASQQFSLAGTVYAVRPSAEPGVPPSALPGGVVALVDAEDAGISLETNAAGNFFVTPSIYDPHWPVHVNVSLGSSSSAMITHISRDGGCAACHFEPPGPSSPGSVYLYFDQSSVPDGGTP